MSLTSIVTAFQTFRQVLAEWFREERVLQVTEILPGVERPTLTLAWMIASEILKQDVAWKRSPMTDYEKRRVEESEKDISRRPYYPPMRYEVTITARAVRVFAQYTDNNNDDQQRMTITVHKAEGDTKYPKKEIEFLSDDMKVIKEAILKAITLTVEREKLRKEGEKHQHALDIIADWMGVSTPEVSCAALPTSLAAAPTQEQV